MDLETLQKMVPYREELVRLDPEIFIVGGSVRDYLLKRVINDFDIVVKKDALAFAKNLSEIASGKLVVLSEEEKEVRFIVKRNLWLDITDRRGKNIEENLIFRDYTVNSLAVPLAGGPTLIDPLNGLSDLKKGIIRTPRKDNLRDDPLRILRAFRLSATLGFRIERGTAQWIKELGFEIRNSSRERIKYELFLIFGSNRVAKTVWLMKELGILEVLFPEILALELTSQRYYQEQNLLRHTWLALKYLEDILGKLPQSPFWSYKEYLLPFLKEKKSKALILLAILFHDIGKPATITVNEEGKTHFYDHDIIGEQITKRIADRLRFSKKEATTLAHLVRWHMYPHFLAKETQATPRALNRYLRRNGFLSFPLVLMAIADAEASPPIEGHDKGYIHLLDDLYCLLKKQKAKPKERLLTGNDLISMGLKPGPIFSKILQEIDDLYAEGKIETREEALEKVKSILSHIQE